MKCPSCSIHSMKRHPGDSSSSTMLAVFEVSMTVARLACWFARALSSPCSFHTGMLAYTSMRWRFSMVYGDTTRGCRHGAGALQSMGESIGILPLLIDDILEA